MLITGRGDATRLSPPAGMPPSEMLPSRRGKHLGAARRAGSTPAGPASSPSGTTGATPSASSSCAARPAAATRSACEPSRVLAAPRSLRGPPPARPRPLAAPGGARRNDVAAHLLL